MKILFLCMVAILSASAYAQTVETCIVSPQALNPRGNVMTLTSSSEGYVRSADFVLSPFGRATTSFQLDNVSKATLRFSATNGDLLVVHLSPTGDRMGAIDVISPGAAPMTIPYVCLD